jgi:hypothetical protein
MTISCWKGLLVTNGFHFYAYIYLQERNTDYRMFFISLSAVISGADNEVVIEELGKSKNTGLLNG